MSARCNGCYTFHLRLPFNIFHSNITGFSILATILYYSLGAHKDQGPARTTGPVYSSRLAHPCAFARSRPRPHPPHSSWQGRHALAPAPASSFTSRRWQEGEACATVVPHQVGCDRRRRCVLSVWDIFRHVASLCFKCFSCFRRIFQVFHLDVAYITMVVHACFKRVFQMFQMFLDLCCKCFIWMLQK
jgi:hypothetical protein